MTCLKRLFGLVLIAFLLPLAYMLISCRSSATQMADETSNQNTPAISKEMRAAIIEVEQNYNREESRTYLTFPEWYIVYISSDYGAFLKDNRPSAFPYFSAALDFWGCYCSLTKLTTSQYPTNLSAHLMIFVIGVSHSAEYLLKGLYENTLGRLFEWLSFGEVTPEEKFAQKTAADYGQFLNTTPWFEYPFFEKLKALWNETPSSGPAIARKWERKIVLTLEYGFKAAYGSLIRLATGAIYEPAPESISLVVSRPEEALLTAQPEIRLDKHLDESRSLITLPRYAAFTRLMAILVDNNITIYEIAGNDEILVTYLMDKQKTLNVETAEELFSMNLPLKPASDRKGASVRLPGFGPALKAIREQGGTYEHAYDY